MKKFKIKIGYLIARKTSLSNLRNTVKKKNGNETIVAVEIIGSLFFNPSKKAIIIKNSDNIAIRYLSNFISIEPSKNSANNSEVMKNFSIVQNKLNKKDIKLSLTYLNLIENSQTHFEKWFKYLYYLK